MKTSEQLRELGGVKGAAIVVGACLMLGIHVFEAARSVRDLLRLDAARGADFLAPTPAPGLDEEALRRELREIGGLAPDTVETILSAARAPIA